MISKFLDKYSEESILFKHFKIRKNLLIISTIVNIILAIGGIILLIFKYNYFMIPIYFGIVIQVIVYIYIAYDVKKKNCKQRLEEDDLILRLLKKYKFNTIKSINLLKEGIKYTNNSINEIELKYLNFGFIITVVFAIFQSKILNIIVIIFIFLVISIAEMSRMLIHFLNTDHTIRDYHYLMISLINRSYDIELKKNAK